MLTILLKDIGQQLSHKPFEWKTWWGRVKWAAFINIYPQLSEENPLWQREDSSLESVQLFGLHPHKLQEKIADYWEKPFWHRWLLSFFTDINNKIIVWSYYKHCLSFRVIHKDNPVLDQRLIVYEAEQRLVSVLVNELKRDNLALENRLERHSGNAKWMQKNLRLILAKHEKKRYRFFFKILNTYLKKLPEECNQESVRIKLEQEYQELEKMLRNYVKNSCQVSVSEQESTQFVEENEKNTNRGLVYMGPAGIAEKTTNPYFDSDLLSSINFIDNWLSSKRHSIEETLIKAESPSYEAIQSLLEKSLESLRLLIEPQLIGYEDVVNAVRHRRVNYKEALQWSNSLQNQLTHLFRHSGLLFHPDKSCGDKNVQIIKTGLFQEYNQFAEHSLERFNQGLKTLKRCIPKWELDFDKIQKKLECDREEFRKRLEQKYVEIKAQQVEIKAQYVEIKKEQAEIQEALNNILQRLNCSSSDLIGQLPILKKCMSGQV